MIGFQYPSKDMLRKIYTKQKKTNKPNKKSEKGEVESEPFLLGLELNSAAIDEEHNLEEKKKS